MGTSQSGQRGALLLQVIVTFAFLAGCRLLGGGSGTVLESAPGPIVTDARIAAGVIRATSTAASSHVAEMREQLAYAVGAFAELGGTADLTALKLELTPKPKEAVDEDGGEAQNSGTDGGYLVAYAATFPVLWEAGTSPPPRASLPLPGGGDVGTLRRFHAEFGGSCAEPTAGEAASFWFRYRPGRKGCSARAVDGLRRLVTTIEVELTARQTAKVAPAPIP